MGLMGALLRALLVLLPLAAAAPQEPPPPAGPKAEQNRRAAHHAMTVAAAEGHTGQAQFDRAKELYAQMTGENPPSKWKKFAKRWYERGLRGESMASKKGGRKPTIDDSLARTIAENWTMQGVGRGSSKRPYMSMEEVSRHGCGCHVSSTAAGTARRRRRRPAQPYLKRQPHCFLHRQWSITPSLRRWWRELA